MSNPVNAVSYSGLTSTLYETAWSIIEPAVEQAFTLRVTERRAGCIVVLPPGRNQTIMPAPLFTGFLKAGSDPNLYEEHALAKAKESHATGRGSRAVQQDAPHLYFPGLSKWGGSVVREDLVCAFSGVEAVLDQMIAGWMADTVIGLCRHEMTRPGGVMDSPTTYLGITARTRSPG